jgi:hypothetical protein
MLDRRTVVAGIAGALPVVAIGAAPALASPDAELIALGERLRVAYEAERAASERGCSDDELDAAMDACSKVVESIIDIPATTLAGLRVKAFAVAWCCNDEPFGGFDDTTDRRVIESLLEDIRAMGPAA